MKFRKKPVTIEAELWDGSALSAIPIVNWILQQGGIAEYLNGVDAPNGTPAIVIDTLEGPITASPGDWIIQGVQGEFYPCKPDIFHQTYEKVRLR